MLIQSFVLKLQCEQKSFLKDPILIIPKVHNYRWSQQSNNAESPWTIITLMSFLFLKGLYIIFPPVVSKLITRFISKIPITDSKEGLGCFENDCNLLKVHSLDYPVCPQPASEYVFVGNTDRVSLSLYLHPLPPHFFLSHKSILWPFLANLKGLCMVKHKNWFLHDYCCATQHHHGWWTTVSLWQLYKYINKGTEKKKSSLYAPSSSLLRRASEVEKTMWSALLFVPLTDAPFLNMTWFRGLQSTINTN